MKKKDKMETPEIQDKRYIQLTANLLLEYRYVRDRWTEQAGDGIPMSSDLLGYNTAEDVMTGTYTQVSPADASSGYAVCRNGYDGQDYFFNLTPLSDCTANTIRQSAFPVDKARTRWCRANDLGTAGRYYGSVDGKWTLQDSEDDIAVAVGDITFGASGTETAPYDILRVYKQAGYVSDYDGFVFDVQVKDKGNNIVNLASVLLTKVDSPLREHYLPSPFFFANKLYSSYIEIRIPSLAFLSFDTSTGVPSDALESNDGWKDAGTGRYEYKMPVAGTLPAFVTEGRGFGKNPSLTLSVFGVTGSRKSKGYTLYDVIGLSSVIFPNRNTQDAFSLRIGEEDVVEGTGDVRRVDYLLAYPYVNGHDERESMYRYLKATGASFTMVHALTVTENYTDSTGEVESYTHAPVMFIQTQEDLDNLDLANADPRIMYRPILRYAERDVSVEVVYEMRLLNNATNTSIVKTASYVIAEPALYGESLRNIKIGRLSPTNVYNRVEKAGIDPSMFGHGSVKLSSVVRVANYNVTALAEKANIVVSLPPVRTEQS